jgi:hypothetical protein
VSRIKGCPNSLAPSVSLLLKHFKRRRRWQKKKTSARGLYRRKRLPIRGKRWKRRSKRGLYNVNYSKSLIRRRRKLKRQEKRLKGRRNAIKKSKISK